MARQSRTQPTRIHPLLLETLDVHDQRHSGSQVELTRDGRLYWHGVHDEAHAAYVIDKYEREGVPTRVVPRVDEMGTYALFVVVGMD